MSTSATGTVRATSPRSAGAAAPSSEAESTGSSGSALATDQGTTTISDSVVTKITGLAVREVSGVYDMGSGASRAVGALRSRLPGSSGPTYGQGVSVEVGERQAAIDLNLIAEYGAAIPDLAAAVRRNVVSRIETMTGLQVTEVNISVDDIHLDDADDDNGGDQPPPRVR